MYTNECCVSAAIALLKGMPSVWEVKEIWWEKRILLGFFRCYLFFLVRNFFGWFVG